jgi:autonomous glycyl radical cofactor GrcA
MVYLVFTSNKYVAVSLDIINIIVRVKGSAHIPSNVIARYGIEDVLCTNQSINQGTITDVTIFVDFDGYLGVGKDDKFRLL